MKVLFELHPTESQEDFHQLELFQKATKFYLALSDFNQLSKDWYKNCTTVNADLLRTSFLEALDDHGLTEEDIL